MIKSRTVLKRNFCTGIFQSFHRLLLEENHYFSRKHFDGYFLSSNVELQMKMELKLNPSFLHYLLTYLLNDLLTDSLTLPELSFDPL